jgi:hypothetical protein
MNTLSIPRLLLIGLGTTLLVAQSATPPAPSPQPSIADLARKIRAAKANSAAPKAKRVFDNDSMPHDPNAKPPSAASETVDAADQKADPKAGAKADAKADKKDDKPKGEDESVWRGNFAKLRATLDTESRRLDVLQRELNLAQIQNYSDPNQALREQFARTDLTKRTAEIESQKQVVDAAKKAIADLEEEGRLKGVPPAWMLP